MLNFLKMFFENTWALFEGTRVPGFNISIASVFLGSVGAVLSIAFLRLIFGMGNPSVSVSKPSVFNLRGGNNDVLRISDGRKGDRK